MCVSIVKSVTLIPVTASDVIGPKGGISGHNIVKNDPSYVTQFHPLST